MSLSLRVKSLLRTLKTSKSGLIGILMLSTIIGISVYALIYVPFDVVSKWNDPSFWKHNPRIAAPQWSSNFISEKQSTNIEILTKDFEKYGYYIEESQLKYIVLETRVIYDFDTFPSEIFSVIYANFSINRPLVIMKIIRPDLNELIIYKNILTSDSNNIFLSTDNSVRENIRDFLIISGINSTETIYPEICLFAVKNEKIINPNEASVLKGAYTIKIEVISSNRSDDVNAEFTIYGKVWGLAGTDNQRRDLFLGLVWGAPVALAFGLTAAIATSFVQSLLGALSAWYGGFVDEVVQRITEVYMILPFLPFLIMISIVYKMTLVTLVLLILLLSIFGGVTMTARSVTLQVMGEQYIEAAISYGASKMRILFFYILPRLMPFILANIVLNVPTFIFLEAALSVLGLGDPTTPTWGKIISDAYNGGAATHGYWWWIILPAILIMVTASAFALIGYALDKIVNPKLRER